MEAHSKLIALFTARSISKTYLALCVNTPPEGLIDAKLQRHPLSLGVIYARELQKPVLGTVTLRDFCNRDETKIPAYFEVISVIDHHKSHLSTTAVPMALIADAQSSNVLCAEMAFEINDRFGSRGMTNRDIEAQIAELSKNLSSAKHKRLLANLLRRQCVIQETPSHFIHPVRETLEYLHFLYGIFDDTDLLAKVSVRDVTCIVELVNRLKSLSSRREEEILTLSDLPMDALFIRKAAQRILQHPDVYSLYQKIYAAKESAVDAGVRACLQGEDRVFFSDTKEQNSCARVGQTKLFPSNYALFAKEAAALRSHFHTRARAFFEDRTEVDLHVHMVSTIAGASEVFSGAEPIYQHQDELWLWIPFNQSSVQHLKEFLHAFSSSPPLCQEVFNAECVGKESGAYTNILKESFSSIGQISVVDTDALSLMVRKWHLKSTDRFGSRGMTNRDIEAQIAELCVNTPPEGLIDAKLQRHPLRRQEMRTHPTEGKEAKSVCKVLARNPYLSFVEVQLLTGRTHQIRVHLKSVGAPVLGDATYGCPAANKRFHATLVLSQGSNAVSCPLCARGICA